jgi:diaminopimelate epimerase
MLINFTKMHGLGNDFVVIDGVTQNIRISADLIKRIANRNTGIGCDQVLILEPPSLLDVDFDYRIFNANGDEVEQCGNGARCLARFIKDRKLSGKKGYRVKTMNRIINLSVGKDRSISVDMGIPKLDPKDIPFISDDKADTYTIDSSVGELEISVVSMGNPHAVILVDDLLSTPVEELGAELEQHSRFPERVNVGFAEIIDRQRIKLRVFERGVGETAACGSGACAAAVCAIQRSLVDSKVNVQLCGGSLDISWRGIGESLMMRGPAVTSFHGRIKV